MRIEAAPRRRHLLPLTSLVDVVFILLFFFMLATRATSVQHIDVRLAGEARTGAVAQEIVYRVQVRAGGVALLGDQVLQPGGGLRARAASEPGARWIVVPQGEATLQDLVGVLDELRAAGAAAQLGSAAR